ncbi:MAG: hypothetical protein IPJ40_02320 [Saprospirales bacterium]|nr:hypothetical protein [Saprospirales bacterium]
MKRLLLPFVLIIASFGLSMASPPGAASYKEGTARRVFDQLVLARGDFGLPKPQFQFVDHPKEVARFSGQTVFLGVKAYDVCVSFGADSLNALAVLLSHELVHYYAGHTWEEEFSRDFAGTQLPDDVKDSWLEDEVQADLWGGLLAYSAGYDVRAVAPKFFPALYKTFERDESLAGYQKLSARILLAKQTGAKIQFLLGYFETANYLVALGLYEDAQGYYETILQEGYRSRELYNNLGVYKVMAALPLFRKTEMPYGLPVELDAESRIGHSTKGGGPVNPQEERLKLLKEANQYFETARNIDPAYTTALINQACVQALLGVSVARDDKDEADLQYTQALVLAKKAEREAKGNAKRMADVQVLRGILATFEGDQEEARSWWEKANSPLAQTNLQILKEGAFSVTGERLPASNTPEQIEELSLDLFLRKPALDTLASLEVAGSRIQWGKSRSKSNLVHSSVYLHLVSTTHFATLQITDPDYSGQTSLGIRIGDSRQKVLDTYKTPDTVMQLARGEFLVYPARNILFQLDEQQKVEGWCVFRVKT